MVKLDCRRPTSQLLYLPGAAAVRATDPTRLWLVKELVAPARKRDLNLFRLDLIRHNNRKPKQCVRHLRPRLDPHHAHLER